MGVLIPISYSTSAPHRVDRPMMITYPLSARGRDCYLLGRPCIWRELRTPSSRAKRMYGKPIENSLAVNCRVRLSIAPLLPRTLQKSDQAHRLQYETHLRRHGLIGTGN